MSSELFKATDAANLLSARIYTGLLLDLTRHSPLAERVAKATRKAAAIVRIASLAFSV